MSPIEFENCVIEEHFVEQTGSTSTDLLNYVKGHVVETPRLLCAHRQTAGRGTRGRKWQNLGESLTFSIAIPITGEINNWAGVTLAIGVAIAKTYRLLGVPALVKWPNDILLNGKKLSGILVEVAQDLDKKWVLVIGVGVNCIRNGSINDETDYGVAFLSDAVSISNKKDWLRAISQSIFLAVTQMAKEGLKPTRESWATISAYSNELVWVFDENGPSYQARVKTIDDMGCLVVETESSIKSLVSGTISLRKF